MPFKSFSYNSADQVSYVLEPFTDTFAAFEYCFGQSNTTEVL